MPTTPAPARNGARTRTLLLVPIFALVALTCWSFASPLGASPDDDFHLASTWCSLGDREGLCEPTGEPSSRLIPEQIAKASICYAYQPDVSAGCQEEYPADEDAQMVFANRGNFGGLYPGVYYTVTGLLASPNIEASAIAMRVLSAVIFLALTTALYIALPLRRRATLAWAWLISLVPLGVFIIASNNPSSWAVIAGGSLWIALVGYFETSGKRRIALGAIAAIAAVLGAGARADAAVYAAVAAVVAMVITFERSRRWLMSTILPVALIVMAAAFYLSASQGSLAAAGDAMASGGADTNPLTLLAANTLNLPLLWVGVFGSWGLGWLDTAMPGVVSVGALLCFVVVAFAGLAFTSRRKNLAMLIVFGALIAFPSYVLWQALAVVGAQVQPRYILPLIVMLAGVMLLAVGDRGLSLSLLQRNVIATILTIAHAIALHFNLRRYISGLDVGSWNLNEQLEWWWGGLSPMALWAIGAVAFGAMAFTLVRSVPLEQHLDPLRAPSLPASSKPTLRS